MDALKINHVPELRDPILVIAFYGWNDAAEAATDTVRHLRRLASRQSTRFEAAGEGPVAEIDPEEFFVFTEQRPTVRITEGATRQITWPTTDFTVARLGNGNRDLILAIGTEPHLKWKTFGSQILALMTRFGAREIVTLGALLADTPHTRPVPVSGGASDPTRAAELGFQASRYEGPTGIVGTLSEACRHGGMDHISLWASVPHYISGGKNPKATLALLGKLTEVYDLGLDLSNLELRGKRYESQISEALKDNPDVQDYVRNLEKSESDDDTTDAAAPDEPAPFDSNDVLDEVNRLLAGDDTNSD